MSAHRARRSAAAVRSAGQKPPQPPPSKRRPWLPVGAVVGLLLLAGATGVLVQWIRTAPTIGPAAAVVPSAGPAPAVPQVLGSPSAPVLVEEYGDFQCPACGQFEKSVGPSLKDLAAKGRIRFAYYPIAFIGKESTASANAALCAAQADRFWPYHDLLFAQQGPENSGYLNTARLLSLGDQVGLGGGDFGVCVTSSRNQRLVEQTTDAASRKGISSTPTVLVNGRKLASVTSAAVLAAIEAG